jgi:hypothetical protein
MMMPSLLDPIYVRWATNARDPVAQHVSRDMSRRKFSVLAVLLTYVVI